MAAENDVEEQHIAALDVEGQTYDVTIQVSRDGTGYLGLLCFAEQSWEDEGTLDRDGLRGETIDEVVVGARGLSLDELTARFRRALAAKRRFHQLRQMTDRVLGDIRHLNAVATSLR